MIQFYDAAKQIRQAVLALQKPKTIAALAVTKFGVGECEELSNHIFCALLKLNRSDIAAIVFGSGIYKIQSCNCFIWHSRLLH
jgi:hypothetical protein